MSPAARQVPSKQLREKAARTYFLRLDRAGRLALASAALAVHMTIFDYVGEKMLAIVAGLQEVERAELTWRRLAS